MTVARASGLFVISGCSGSGKSTLLDALARRGEEVVPEPGREIVREQIEAGGDALPWADAQRFIDLCAERAIRDFDRSVRAERRVFFDRSFVDVAAATALTGLPAPDSLARALRTKRYAPLVFISPPWEALFRSDPERRHGIREARAEYEVLVPTYRRHGYELRFLPRTPVRERVSYVLSALSARTADRA